MLQKLIIMILQIHIKILKTSVNVTKEWNDQDNQDGKRAKQVIVHLYANGKDTGKTLTLSDDNQWISSLMI